MNQSGLLAQYKHVYSKLKEEPSVQVCKVYLGSFNDKPIRTDLNPHGKELFEREQENLLQDLYEIPQRSCDRKASQNLPSLTI